MKPSQRMAVIAPDWWGHYPVRPIPNGFEFNLGHGVGGAILMQQEVHYWDGRWKEMDDRPVEDHSGGFGFPYALKTRILPGGAIVNGRNAYKLLSMGVRRGKDFVPIWKPGPLKVEDGARVVQSLGPYDVVTSFEGCGRKQEILLPGMPSVDGDELVLEYAVEGMLPPHLCPCAPIAIGAEGTHVPMRKWRTAVGRLEAISLDVLAGMAFPVILDPTVEIQGGGPWARGQRCTYAAARNSASSWTASAGCQALGQYITGVDYSVNRHAQKVNCNALSSTELNAVRMRASCCSTALTPDNDDTMVFKQADWKAWDPPDLVIIENIYDEIRTSTLGADLWTTYELNTAGCFPLVADCVLGSWHSLSAADITYLSTHYFNLASPNKYLYAGLCSKNDHNNTAPTNVDAVNTREGSATCGVIWEVTYGGITGGGWVWVIS